MNPAVFLLFLISTQPEQPAPVPGKEAVRSGANEPSISEVQRAAARHAGYDLERAATWKKNAARAAWLPVFTVRVKKENFSNDGEKYNSETPYEIVTFNDGIYFEFIAQWNLERLIFRREELDASRENASAFESYRRLMEEVGRLYFRRKALVEELSKKDLTGEQRFEKDAVLQETTAMLDAVTGGYFSRTVSGAGNRSGGGAR